VVVVTRDRVVVTRLVLVVNRDATGLTITWFLVAVASDVVVVFVR